MEKNKQKLVYIFNAVLADLFPNMEILKFFRAVWWRKVQRSFLTVTNKGFPSFASFRLLEINGSKLSKNTESLISNHH